MTDQALQTQPTGALDVRVDDILGMSITSVRERIEFLKLRKNLIDQLVDDLMEVDVHYGRVPGTDKPTLLQPGAELLNSIFLVRPDYTTERLEEDGDHRSYTMRCDLIHIPSGQIIGSGRGACSTKEKKYAVRKAGRECPSCKRADTLKRSKFPPKDQPQALPGWYCYSKAGGCGAEFAYNERSIQEQETGVVANEYLADTYNTVLKIGDKRCLHANTAVLLKTARGITRSSVKHLAEMFAAGTSPLFLPGVDGAWRRVENVERSTEPRHSTRLVLYDGAEIYATPEHRFPTSAGLKSVAELVVGDRLARSRLPIDGDGAALPEIGWFIGLFIAEGCYADEGGLRITLCSDEMHIAKRVQGLAEMLGCTSQIKVTGKTLRLDLHGKPLFGLCGHFVEGNRSSDKHLTRLAWRQGADFLRALLDGYLIGDGHLKRSGEREYWTLNFSGRNLGLAQDLRALAAMLGWRIALHRRWATLGDQKHPVWRGWLRTEAQAAAYHPKCLEEIVAINAGVAKSIVYDIQVDGDHLFCLGDGVATHNSLIAATKTAYAVSDRFSQDQEDEDETEGAATGTGTGAKPKTGAATQPTQAKTQRAAGDGPAIVIDIATKPAKNGGTLYTIAFKYSDGREVRGTTFDKGMGEAAGVAKEAGAYVVPTFKQNGNYNNLVGLVDADAGDAGQGDLIPPDVITEDKRIRLGKIAESAGLDGDKLRALLVKHGVPDGDLAKIPALKYGAIEGAVKAAATAPTGA